MSSKFYQNFSVTRRAPELIAPARPTPREVKQLSDIDDQESLRFQVPVILFYKDSPSPALKGKDPVKVIREAISKALVFYYPLAGRLKEGDNRKLMVDCNGQGILFIEADADFKLKQLGEYLSPSSYLDEVLYNVPGSDGILGCPVLLIQVTRLKCGGFILALRLNHTMCDGLGLVQFLKTIEEMARGKNFPSVFPVWQRQLLNARNPPQVTCIHHEYGEEKYNPDTDLNDMDNKSFFFGPKEMRALRNQLPYHLKNCSNYELCVAVAWKCRTIALNLEPEEIVRISCLINVRGKNYNMQLPSGYYGNAIAFPAECAKAEALCRNPLWYAVELVKKAKGKMNEEYIRSTADLMVIKGRQIKYPTRGNFIVSDITKVGFGEVDFGWGKPIYAGTAGAVSLISFLMKYQNKNGEPGVLLPMYLPMLAMKRFEEELKRTMQESMEDLCDVKQQTQIFCKL